MTNGRSFNQTTGTIGAPEVAAAVGLATAALLARQSTDGSWCGELRTDITHDAEGLLLKQFLGIRDDAATEEAARWIRAQQRADGTWSTEEGGSPDPTLTGYGYLALRLAGDRPEDHHLAMARAYLERAGGLAVTSVLLRTWLAMFGQWSWRDLPALPPQLILMPRSAPVHIYRFAAWIRTLMVPMMAITAYRPTRTLGIDIRAELPTGESPRLPTSARLARAIGVLPGRRRALRAITDWLLAHQDADGTWFYSRPAGVWALIALHLSGYRLDHPVMLAGLAALEDLTVCTDGRRHAVMFRGDAWDTSLALLALTETQPRATMAMHSAADYLLRQQATLRADWSVARPTLRPGGWGFAGGCQTYPDVNDTALAVWALRRVDYPARADDINRAIDLGINWALGMQCAGGGWAAHDADNTSDLADKLFTYIPATDRPCPEITGHVLVALEAEGLTELEQVRRGVEFLRRGQRPGGSWPGRWMVHHIYGTSCALYGLVAAGVPAEDESVRRGVDWLIAHQNDDGGWGEDLRSLLDDSWLGRGASTASQTAWGLLGLLAAGGPRQPAVRRAVDWLVTHQRSDGWWTESQPTGLLADSGTVGYLPLRYELYPLEWPLFALGRYARLSQLDRSQ